MIVVEGSVDTMFTGLQRAVHVYKILNEGIFRLFLENMKLKIPVCAKKYKTLILQNI